jgi:hypothetical protein
MLQSFTPERSEPNRSLVDKRSSCSKGCSSRCCTSTPTLRGTPIPEIEENNHFNCFNLKRILSIKSFKLKKLDTLRIRKP